MTNGEPKREDFLFHMYDQMFNDINRHIMVVWQSIGVLVGAFAILALAEKNVITIDVAAALLVLIAGWSVSHHLDASYWYNRNLAIIANIEKQFLQQSDLKDIHYYFGSHRPENRMIAHLRIQVALALGIALVVLYFHFDQRVLPGMSLTWDEATIGLQRMLPYVVAVVAIIYALLLRHTRNSNYTEFITNSPGASVDATGIHYGPGHGFRKGESGDD